VTGPGSSEGGDGPGAGLGGKRKSALETRW